MEIQIPKGACKIIELFKKNNFEIYIVGGAVRDVLMGKNVYDWDFTTNATPEQILSLVKNAYYTNSFGMVGIPEKDKSLRPYEITTFRTEHGYTDSRRPDHVEWGRTLEEDLQRRDFTINAMALKPTNNPSNFDILDFYEGKKDLNNKLLRAVGNPDERFAEDALRMMRAVRISSEIGFSIEEKTLNAIRSNAHLLNKISGERVRDEFLKTLSSPNPDKGILMFKDANLLKEILPELVENFGVPQASPGRHHIYDVGTHSVLALKFVSEKTSDPIVRLATLIHDIGKATTFKKLDSGTITFYNHEIISARIAKRLAERLRLSNNDKDKLWRLVRFHQFTLDENQTDSAIRRFIKNVGKDLIRDILDLRVGDRLGGGARETSWRLEEFKARVIEVQKQPFRIQDLKISGLDVMKILQIKSGPKVGEILTDIYKEVVNKKIENKRELLLKKLSEKITK